jgi:hypothetical protein
MSEISFRFQYVPTDGGHRLSAYDASQALYGISRSISIISHYALTEKIKKQAPTIESVEVLIEPPRRGSLEFIVPVIEAATDPSTRSGAISLSLAAGFIFEGVKYFYRRLTGQSEKIENARLSALLRQKPGDVDAIADTIEDDIIKIHRPFEGPVTVLKIYGGHNHFADFNKVTYDFAKTKERSTNVEGFIGNVASLNAITFHGRFWVNSEERTVGFREDQFTKLGRQSKQILSWSLNEYANGRPGTIKLAGYPLRSRQGMLKMIFVTKIDRVRGVE